MSNGKNMIVVLIVGLIKNHWMKFSWMQFYCIKMS